jgi:hypothetical protein
MQQCSASQFQVASVHMLGDDHRWRARNKIAENTRIVIVH